MSKPTIYLYKVTFEETFDFYWGIHKEKKAGEPYFGSPVTHAWKWEFYTPKVNICQLFDYTDEGWRQAQEIEKQVILHDWNNPRCLNEACGGNPSLEVLRKSGQKTAKLHMQEKDERGKCRHFVEMRKKVKNLRPGDNVDRMNEVIHAEKNEEGKSLHALRLNAALHRDKDEEGKSLHTLKLHKEKDVDGKSAHAKKMAEARWGEDGKNLSVTYPDGSTKIFDSLTSASKDLRCNIGQLSGWARKSHTPRKGKLAGHTVCYVHHDQGKTT